MKLSRKTKNWLKIQGEIYDKFLDSLGKPGIVDRRIMCRLQEILDQNESRLRAEGFDDIEIEAHKRAWLAGLR